MSTYLKRLQNRHRRLDRLIDTSKAAGRQEELKKLKRIRLQLKDRISELTKRSSPLTR